MTSNHCLLTSNLGRIKSDHFHIKSLKLLNSDISIQIQKWSKDLQDSIDNNIIKKKKNTTAFWLENFSLFII